MALPIEQYGEFKRTQQAALAEHRKFAQSLQEKRQQNELRGADLELSSKMLKVLDPRTPKPARKFLMTKIAQALSIDPKTETFKDILGVINSLQPDQLQGLRAQFSETMKTAEPGEITQQTQGILSGAVPLDGMLDQINMMAPTAEAENGVMSDAVAKPGTQGSGAGAVRSFEGTRTTPEDAKQASPQLVKALGLDPKIPMRNGDLIAQGFSIPFDSKDQEKLANEISISATNVASTIRESARIVKLFEGRPETLGTVGNAVRGLQGAISQVSGAMRMLNPAFVNDSNPYAPETKKLAKEVSTDVARANNYTIRTAEDAARIEAAVLGLAYRMAGAQNIPGNRLTNGIIDQQLRQIGQSSSPEQFKAVLTDTLDGTIRTFDEGIRRQLGVSGNEMVAKQLTDQDIVEFAGSGAILPQEFSQALRTEAVNRRDGVQKQQPQPSQPTIQQEQETLGDLETQRKTRELEKFDQERDLAAKRDQRATQAEERAETREERMVRQNEESNKLARERFTYEKDMGERRDERAEEAAERAESREERVLKSNEAQMGLAREKFEYDKSKDSADREQRRNDKIGEAFRAFGHAIANSMSGSGGGGGGSSAGPGQDVGAFRLTPMPQRTPPAIPRGGN